jgi:hypothetical protein
VVGYPVVTPISPTCLGLWTSTNCAITGIIAGFRVTCDFLFVLKKTILSAYFKASI